MGASVDLAGQDDAVTVREPHSAAPEAFWTLLVYLGDVRRRHLGQIEPNEPAALRTTVAMSDVTIWNDSAPGTFVPACGQSAGSSPSMWTHVHELRQLRLQ